MVNKYYQKHKERLQKEARERYQNLSEEEKDKRRKKTRVRYQNFIEEEKEKRRQYYQERKKKLPDERNFFTFEKFLNFTLDLFQVTLFPTTDTLTKKQSKQVFTSL